MKHLLVASAIVAAALATQIATAQPLNLTSLTAAMSYQVVAMNCSVNGVVYPVDQQGNVWAVNAYGNWFIIGHLQMTAGGYVVIRNDGTVFPAVCG
jgi:hypothetical protein